MQKEKKQRRMKTYTRYYQEYIMLEISTLGITSTGIYKEGRTLFNKNVYKV